MLKSELEKNDFSKEPFIESVFFFFKDVKLKQKLK